MSRYVKLVAILACVTLVVAACGKRGALEPPPGAVASKSTKKGKGKPVEQQSHREFVLDGLLK